MVPGAGLEPAQRERRGILNPLCLPIPPSGLGKKVEGAFRSRTGRHGFAIRYITALLTRQILQAFQPDIRLRPMSFKLERETRTPTRDPDLGKVVLLPTEAIPAFIKQSVNHLILLSSGNQCRRSMRCILLTWRDESTIFFTTFDRLLKIAPKRSLIKQICTRSAQILQH